MAEDKPPVGRELGSVFAPDSPFGEWDNGKVYSEDDHEVFRYREMLDTDGKAAQIEKLLTYPILAAGWEIEGAKGDKGEQEFIYDALTALPHQGGPKTTVEQFVSQMTTAFTFRRAYFEKVYKVNDSGKVVYDKIDWRPPETCELALDARSGEPRGFRQMPVRWNPRPTLMRSMAWEDWVDIPSNRAFVYVHGTWRDPLLGFSQMKLPYWALAHGSKVQTPFGEVNIEDLVIGDEVYGANGSPTKVIAVHPQGVRQMYRVTFKDGRTVDCDAEHLWGINYTSNGSMRYKVMSTKDIINSGLRTSHGRFKYSVPRTQAVEYQHKFVPVDFYILGAWLGDGHITKDQDGVGRYAVSVASTEEFIPSEIERRLPSDLKLVRSADQYFVRPVVSRDANPLRDALVSMGVNVDAREKFIPDLYLEGSVKQRWDLLRGLMDTDGSYGHGSGKPSNASRFHTVSNRLAEDVQRLVRSLGGTAIVRYKSTRDIYTVELLTNESPFLMPRKDAMWCPSDRRETLAIVNIETIGESECRCITVENSDGLFLTNDYVVTHNCYTTKRKIRWLWYQFLETTSLPKVIVRNQDELKAREDAKKMATLKSRGVLGMGEDTKFDVLESSGKGAEQFLAAIRFLDSEMSNAILAGFMDLSSSAAEGKGSYALSESQGKLFLRTRRMVARDMARQITNDIIGPLVRYNFGNDAAVPRFVFGPLSEQNEQTVLDTFAKVATTGAKVPVEFYDELVTRVSQLLELDPGKVANDIKVNGSPIQQIDGAVDRATGMIVEAQQQNTPGPNSGRAGQTIGQPVFGTNSVANGGPK